MECYLNVKRRFKSATRKEIDQLLWSKLSNALDETKKLKKVDNLLTDLRNKGEITNIGSRKEPIWQLQGIKIKLGIKKG